MTDADLTQGERDLFWPALGLSMALMLMFLVVIFGALWLVLA